MGKKAAQLLFDHLAGKAVENNKEIVLPSTLVIRESSISELLN
jgi:LacI family transcriptional regulator